jgi:hypothetical protein
MDEEDKIKGDYFLRVSRGKIVDAILFRRPGQKRLENFAGEGTADDFKITLDGEVINLSEVKNNYDVEVISSRAALKYKELFNELTEGIKVTVDFGTFVLPGE